MRQWLPVVVIVLVFAALGITNLPAWRGSTTALALQLQTKLDGFPTTLGPWQSESSEIAQKTLSQAEAQGHISRVYQKPNSPDSIKVLVLVGSPGAMGAHTPEVCYSGLGYQRIGKVEKIAVPGEANSQLWTTLFEKPNERSFPLQVVWGHGVGGRWLASDTPRLDFATESLIFKVYVSRTKAPSRSTAAGDDELAAFLELFFQEFRRTFPKE
jgi:hypothetical protein